MDKAWQRLLIDVEFAKNYTVPYRLTAFGGAAVKNPVLERLLPSLLQVKLVALLDDAFQDALDQRGVKPPNKYSQTAGGRARFFRDTGLVKNGQQLVEMTARRNQLGHEIDAAIDWRELDADIDTVDAALRELGYVAGRPKLEVRAEKGAMKKGSQNGVAFESEYKVEVMLGNKVLAAFKWVASVYND